MVLLLTIAVSMIIIAVSITSYLASKSVLQEELSEPQMQMLQINMNYVEDYIKKSDQIAIQLALNSQVYQFLMNEQQNSYDNITKLYELLTTLINNTDYINSIYIYDTRRSSFLAIPQGYHSSRQTFVDSEWVDIVDEFGDEMMLVRGRDVPEGGKRQGSNITLFRKIVIRNELRGVIAINYQYEELFANLQPLNISKLNSARFVLDHNHEVLYSTVNHHYDPGIVDALMKQLKDRSFGDVVYQNKRLLANQLQSPLTDWKYISIVSQESLLAKSKNIRNVVLSVSIGALLLGALAIFYIHSIAFRPVRRMMRLFKHRDGEVQQPDLEHLAKLTDELMSDHAQLTQLIRQTMPEASSKFIYDYCLGNLHNMREVQEKWSSYFPNWTDAPLTIAVISIDDYEQWASRFPSSDHSLLKFALANVVAEVLTSDWRTECVDFGKDKLTILLQPSAGKSLLTNQFTEAVDVVQRLLKFTISVGISTPQGNIRKLRQAMFEAENALSYRLYKGNKSVISFIEVSEHEMTDHIETSNSVEELIEAVEAGDAARAIRMLERMIEEIRQQYWFPSAALAFLKTVGERLQRSGINRVPGYPMADGYAESMTTIPLDEIERLLRQQINRLTETLQALVQSKDFMMCQRMIEYMKQHLSESIGVQEIAEYCGISVSLASQLFKQEMNETIYGYFTKLRIERAAELLVQTDERIHDIALQVGYQHENSFIRVFRKYKDITPGKYREMMQNRLDPIAE